MIYTEIQPDNLAGLSAGVIGITNLNGERKGDDWGSISAWAWGLSRIIDYFETDNAIDAKHVVMAGGGYARNVYRRVERAVLPVATYVMATEPLGPRLKDAIDEVVRQQVEARVDIVSDGEFSKGRNWAFYIHDRLSGLSTRPLTPEEAKDPMTQAGGGSDRKAFPEFYAE